ncbi:MAG TPA: hypothetical protein VH253_01245 [Phycisphaerae bacterium]|nr:hypothetical protein [Phycisphaerae bacterium]
MVVKMSGMVKGGVIVPEGTLPEGTRVDISAEVEGGTGKEGGGGESVRDFLLKFAGTAEGGYPADYALNHDHYLYGAPRRQEGA